MTSKLFRITAGMEKATGRFKQELEHVMSTPCPCGKCHKKDILINCTEEQANKFRAMGVVLEEFDILDHLAQRVTDRLLNRKKPFEVKFEIYGKKMKTTVEAVNEDEAKQEVMNRLNFISVTPEGGKDIMDAINDILNN